MANIGRNIETAIQSMMKISEEIAEMQGIVDAAKNDLNMLDTLFSVSKYISLNPEQHVIMAMLEDSVKGVFGASYCQVIYDNDKTHLSNSHELYHYLDFEQLKQDVNDILVIRDASESQVTTLEEGSLVLIRLSVGDELYGFLASYWSVIHDLSQSSLVFLQIISNQVSMFLKSNSLIEKFKALAVNDPLTGIYNRSYFNNIEESTQPILGESIVMFDIDHFKKVNDTMGHQFGDKVLIEFAQILTTCSDEIGAVPFKYGGEEFIIKCEGGQEKAVNIAEKVRKAFKAKTGYSVSAGISTIGDTCNVLSYKRLLGQADSALYVSKQSGRDRSTTADGDIQILKESVNALIRLFSKTYRTGTKATIYRLIIKGQKTVNPEQFSQLQTILSGIGRMYDDVILTDSLDVIFIMDGVVKEEQFKKRINDSVSAVFKDLSYEVYALERNYNEIVNHCNRVARYSSVLGKQVGLEESEIEQMMIASKWYDAGKLCINPKIYSKQAKITPDEYDRIKLHTWMGYHMVKNHPTLSDYAEWVLYHHENWDGSGYYGLKGNDIPLPAQIIALLDKFTALTEKRAYRDAYHLEEALSILDNEKKQVDAKLYREFVQVVSDMEG